MHPTDTALLAIVHGELWGSGAEEVRLHLDDCASCSSRRDSMRREEEATDLSLRVLDLPVPQVSAATIRTRALARRRIRAVAASIGALVTLASAAAAMPGSPVRAWFVRLLNPTSAVSTTHLAAPVEAQPAADGIEIPVQGALIIELRHAQRAGRIQIVGSDGRTAAARAIGGDVGYVVGPGRVILDNRRPAVRYEITLPHHLTDVTLLVGGRVLWRLKPGNPESRLDTLAFDLSR